jgi:predicted RNA-binding protein YlqC (UPF0109 family)
LVDHPEQIEGEQILVLELKVVKDDIGKIIGKQGRTARAIRTILSAASGKIKKTQSPGDYRIVQYCPS